MTRALILIDLQNDYFPGGAMALEGMDDAAANARRALTAFRDRGLPLVHIQHLSVRPGATFFVPNTRGVEFNAAVKPVAGESQVQKNFPNAFRNTNLLEMLRARGVTELCITGAMSHMCVDATTRAAFDYGFACNVLEDACATRALTFKGATIPAAQVHGAFMAALAVPYAKIVSTQDALAAQV